MAKKKDVHIHVLLDRTGSMETIRDETIGGFNAFLEEQQGVKGKATFSLVQFDSQDPYEVIHDFKDVKDVGRLSREKFVPRGTTPLLDAVGRSINDVEEHLSSKKSDVVFVIITDGMENASREFTYEKVKEMLDSKKKEGWQVVFLSADLESASAAINQMGIRACSTMAFNATLAGTQAMYSSVSNNIADYRKGAVDAVEFSEKDRTDAMK